MVGVSRMYEVELFCYLGKLAAGKKKGKDEKILLIITKQWTQASDAELR